MANRSSILSYVSFSVFMLLFANLTYSESAKEMNLHVRRNHINMNMKKSTFTTSIDGMYSQNDFSSTRNMTNVKHKRHVRNRLQVKSKRRQVRDVASNPVDVATQDSECRIPDQQMAALSNSKHTSFYMFNDSNFNLAMIWTGTDGKELMALSTMEYTFFSEQSQLWISKDFGRSFVNINHRIRGAVIKAKDGVFKSSIDPQRVILVSYMEDQDMSQTRVYVTLNGGETFDESILPFYLDGAIVFHSTATNMLLAHSPYQQFKLWVSDDFGIHWRDVQSNVMSYSWGTKEMEPGALFVLVSSGTDKDKTGSGTRKLLRSTDYGKTFLAIKMNVYSFGVQGKFVFAAVDGGKGDNGRILYVSKDDGKTWSPTQLPVVTSDRFFSVLDMNEGMLFMHVDDEGDTGSGTLYTSDADGIVFSVSLKKHLFAEGSATTDFYRVASMRGVYMASQVGDDLSIHTNITFDRGGIWHPVKAPKGSKCKNSATSCSLQIHNRYSQIKGVNAPSSPLSQSSAVGLILAHGNVADALETHPPDVFISNDGGYNWTKALSGPHHYTVTNHGGLLLAISAEQDVTNTIKFSYDEGHCWNEYKFCDEPFSITGLLPEPSTNSLNVSIWGFGSEDRRWRIVTIDFSAVLKDECTEKDFDEWVPHLSNERRGCLLGLNETFERVKPDSLCRLNYAHEPKAKQSNPCSCTKDDYECDFGFSRKGESKECKVSADVDPSHLDICINGNEEKINTWGYRKIPGDMCVNGFQPVRSMDTLQQQCTSGLESNLSVEQLDGHQVKTWTIVMILLAVAFFSGILVFLLYRHNKLPCTRPSLASYRYSQLSDGDNLDKMIDLESHPTYHDSSDEEILE
ncbi:sortilin-like [Patiria miniata]|uniref:VPS10 domain-containing protein n=2 Tax=Patiria miniata TaxID=46514 RepID=A0A914BBS6_PATMI|nr:sortilin-like [Patiria miniata]